MAKKPHLNINLFKIRSRKTLLFATGGVILISAFLFFKYYVRFQYQKTTSDQRYIHFEQLNLDLKIPNGLIFEVPSSTYLGSQRDIIDFKIKSNDQCYSDDGKYFCLNARYEPTNIPDDIPELYKKYCAKGGVWENCRTSRVNGVKMYFGEHRGEPFGDGYGVMIPLKSGVLEIGVNVAENNIELTNQILSTFKFTD